MGEDVSAWVHPPWRQNSREAVVQQHALDHSESLQAGFSNSRLDVAEYECGRGFLLLVVLVINLSSCKTDLELERSADTWDSDSAEEEEVGRTGRVGGYRVKRYPRGCCETI